MSNLLMVDLLLDGDASAAFRSHQPPGHHALPTQAMGFCLFNNIAVAARYALDVRRVVRVMISDWDVHHGNSTSHVGSWGCEVMYRLLHRRGPVRRRVAGPVPYAPKAVAGFIVRGGGA